MTITERLERLISRNNDADSAFGILRDFFVSVFTGLLRDTLRLLIAFCIGTVVSAGVCLYYGLPLVLSLIGGFIVLGVAVLFLTNAFMD